MYLPSALVSDIDELGLLDIVQGINFGDATSMVAYERLREMDLSAIDLTSTS